MTNFVDNLPAGDNHGNKPLARATGNLFKPAGNQPSESELALAYGMARDFAERNFTRGEAEVLIRKYVPSTEHWDLTSVLEKAFTNKNKLIYPALTVRGMARYCLNRAQGRIKVRARDNNYLLWNGQYWAVIHGHQHVEEHVKIIAAELLERLPQAERGRYQAWWDDRDNLRDIMAEMRHEAEPVGDEELRDNPDLLLVKNGVYSIARNELIAAPPESYVTDACQCQAKFTDTHKTALWRILIDDFCAGDKALMVYLQMLFGYILCSDTNSLEKIIIIQNQGHNGGSLFLDLITRILGSYVGILPAAALSSRSAVMDDFSYLSNKRLLLMHDADLREPWEPNRLLALAKSKRMSGWNHHQQQWVDFALTGKLVIETHYVPPWLSTEHEIARQVIVIPLADSCIRDHRLNIARIVGQFDTENILGWLIKGYQLFQAAKGKIEMPPIKPEPLMLK